MSNTISSWLLPVLLTVGCITLAMNILNARKANKSLVENIDRARADLRVAIDTSLDCSKQLEMKSIDMTAKDQQLASLTADVKALTDENNQIKEQLSQLHEQLEQTNADKNVLVEEKEKLARVLEASKVTAVQTAKEKVTKEEAKVPEGEENTTQGA